MLRSLDFQIQIIKFCIRGLLKFIALETRQSKMAGYKTLRDGKNKAARPKWPFTIPEYLMMFENEDCETDGAVNEFRKQHDICSEEL